VAWESASRNLKETQLIYAADQITGAFRDNSIAYCTVPTISSVPCPLDPIYAPKISLYICFSPEDYLFRPELVSNFQTFELIVETVQ
jgi:biotin synthase-like enzyme